jgi:hypothetical protein
MSQPTTIPKAESIVVVVGGPSELVDATRNAAGIAAAAKLERAELNNAATVIAGQRPFAIVMSEDIYAFDAGEFDALARDVRATLIRIDTSKSTRQQLERALMPKLAQALRKYQG